MVNLMLFTSLVMLNIVDAVLTEVGQAHEINPLIGALMDLTPAYWMHVKVCITTILSGILLKYRRTKLLALGVSVYSVLACYHTVILSNYL